MSFNLDTLVELLPAIYRIRDAEHGGPLEALLGVIAEQVAVLEENLDQLYDDQFIETCAEWVVPYIGDALGMHTLSPGGETSGYSLRAYVANTIAYRRRKGTAAVLEQLARDVTRWPARVVEFFQLLATTQYLNHQRASATSVSLRDAERIELLDTPFDRLAHTAEVRRITSRRGRYNIPHVGVFLWRLQAYPIIQAPAEGANGLYHFNTLGCDAPLFHQPVTETEITHLAEEVNVPGPIRPRALQNDLRGYRDQFSGAPGADRPQHSQYYGPEQSLAIYQDGALVPPLDLVVADLSSWERPCAGKVAVDPRRGRLAFAAGGEPSQVDVSYNYGFSADVGGGPYDRQDTLASVGSNTLLIRVARSGPIGTLQAARDQWEAAGRPDCVVRIEDNGVYGGAFSLSVPANTRVAIEASDGVRPIWRTVGNTVIEGPENARFRLNGVLIQGALQIKGDLDCHLIHCTLVPGRLLAEDGEPLNPDLDSLRTTSSDDSPTVTISHSIVGPIRLPSQAGQLTIRDSIVDAPPVRGDARPAIAADDANTQPGPEAVLARCTIFGPVYVQSVEASEVIFVDRLRVERRQTGCLRFSYAPPGSQTPRRYRCQPDLALAAYAKQEDKALQKLGTAEVRRIVTRLRPRFTSRRYSHPAYAQLSTSCAAEIRTGAEDGAEMGVYSALKQPQREANLRAALREYLRFGLEAGIFYVT